MSRTDDFRQGTAPISARLRELVSDASFVTPDWVATSAWFGHAPFAAWLVAAMQPRLVVELGVYSGFSYFTLCEAAERYATNAKLVGIDNWEGDEHAGPLEAETRQRVEAYNHRYRSRSSLVTASFDVAADRFSEGEIDLLHIDGLHTYESARHDVETWLPKVSGRGVVLLHDTEVRERGFGVWRVMDELETKFPTFRFPHCHGLGVVGVGTELPAAVGALLAADDNDESRSAVREAYELLGSRIDPGHPTSGDPREDRRAQGSGSDRCARRWSCARCSKRLKADSRRSSHREPGGSPRRIDVRWTRPIIRGTSYGARC